MSKQSNDKIHTFIAFGDSHGDLADPFIVERLVSHIKAGFMGRPWDYIINLGDTFDARAWRRNASPAERRESQAADKKAGLDFIYKTRPRSKSSKYIYHFGNHCDRILEVAEGGAGPESDNALDWKNDLLNLLRKIGCEEVIPYNRKYGKWRLGPIVTIHGFRAGKQAVAKEALTYCYPGGCLIMGHLHRFHRENIEKDGGAVGISVPCVGDIDRMEYADRTAAILTWNQGWVYGYWNETTGKWRVFEAIKEGKNIRVITGYESI